MYCPMVSLLSPSRDRVASRNSLSQKTVRCLKKLPRNTGPWKVQRGSLAAKGRVRSCDGHRIVVAAAEIPGNVLLLDAARTAKVPVACERENTKAAV